MLTLLKLTMGFVAMLVMAFILVLFYSTVGVPPTSIAGISVIIISIVSGVLAYKRSETIIRFTTQLIPT